MEYHPIKHSKTNLTSPEPNSGIPGEIGNSMDKSELSLSEKLYFRLKSLYLANRLPFISAMLAGFAAHMFMFTNKLVNHDDIEALFY